MKKAFAYKLCVVIIISMLAMIILSYYIQITSAKKATYANSLIRINQISQILDTNRLDIDRLRENLEEDYFIRAKAAAYIVQNNPKVIDDLEEIKKVASLLQVDELHFFDPEGRLFAGSEPKYYDYTFHSGEQMQFFLPMLEDNSLQLCQEVVPNTAESKMMQYIAVWREDHQGIIQIGMEPIRLMDAMAKNNLSYIFTMVTTDKDSSIFVADRGTGKILGSTNEKINGRSLEEIGIDPVKAASLEEFRVDVLIEGIKGYCVIKAAGDTLIGVSTTYESLYNSTQSGMTLIVISLCILSAVIIVVILKLLDNYIIKDIHEVISGMNKIASGDLDLRLRVDTSPEFIELSDNINHMVMSLLETTGKLSLVFENVNIPIAAYEYSRDMKRVLATSKLGEILMLSDSELHSALGDHHIFNQKITEICSNPYREEDDVYLIQGKETHFVKLKSYNEKNKTLGIMVDVTNEMLEKQQIQLERDIDLLTGLFNRRAFYHESEKLFRSPQCMKTACLLMMDVDNLKYTNDNWGHEYGDILLKTASDILNRCSAPHKLAARLGGDEFALLIYNEDSEKQIQQYIDDLYQQIVESRIGMPGGHTISVCLSGGYLFYPKDSLDFNEMIYMADQTMYNVKKDTKGYFAKYIK